MRFLSRFLTTLRGFFRSRSESVTAGTREPPEATLSRFILERNKISGSKANYRAFMPPLDLKLSTFNIDNLTANEIWTIGDCVRVEHEKERLYGRADFQASSAYNVNLTPVRDDKPHRHVLILGWPDQKPQQMNRAQLLAASTAYVPAAPLLE